MQIPLSKRKAEQGNSSIGCPHDGLIKAYLSDLAVAENFLELILPEWAKEHYVLSSLELVSASFIGRGLKQSHADIVYKLSSKDGNGWLYVHIEHQSSVDRQMPARILVYQSHL